MIIIDKYPFKRNIAATTASAIIGGAAALGSAGMNAWASGKMNKRAEKFNREEAAAQREYSTQMWNETNAWNLEQWQRENEYNSPISQVQRLRDAGLNPLYYGLDGSSAGDLSAAQPLGYQRADAPNYTNPIGAGIDAAVKVAQVANIQADTAKKNNENLTETQRREKLIADIEVAKQELNNKLAEEGLTDAQRAKIEKETGWLDRLNEAIVSEKESSAKLNDSQRKRIEELLEGEKILQSKSIEDFEHKWQKIKAEISAIAANNKILAKDLENYALNHANNGFMGTGASIPNLIRLFTGGSEPKEESSGSKETRQRNADAAATIYDNK